MTSFNQNDIFNLTAGKSPASSLCLGGKSLIKFTDYTRSLPYFQNLILLYGYDFSTQRYNESNPANTSVTMKNYVTGSGYTGNYGYFSTAGSIHAEGLYYTTAQDTYTVNNQPDQYTHFACFRVATNKLAQGTIMKFYKNENEGFHLYYTNGKISCRYCCNSASTYHETFIDVDPHEYHVYAFACDKNLVKIYADGVFVAMYKVKVPPCSVRFYSDYSNGVTTCFNIYFALSKCLSRQNVKKASYWVKSRIKPQEFVPFEKGFALYDRGNLCKENSGGWTLFPDETHQNTVCRFGENAIELNGYNEADGTSTVGVATSDLIDFTPYTKLYFLVSSSLYQNAITFDTSYRGVVCGYSTKTDRKDSEAVNVYSFDTASSITGKVGQTIDDAGIVCIDISNANGLFSPFIIDGSGSLTEDVSKVYKVWLG